jgi:hypothetical protein
VSGGPIFLGGLAFTGKTPLRIALTAHPRLVLTRHTALWVRYHGCYGDLADARNLDRCLATMASDPAVAVLAPDRRRIEREFRAGPATYAHLFELVHRHHAERLGKQRWGEQMGRFEHHADRVLTAYAGAQMVHMVRDPRTWLGAAVATRSRRPGRLGREAARWRESADLAVRNPRRYGGRYLVVRYEALRGDPDATLRRVAAFLGEDFHPAMISALAGVHIDDPRHRAVSPPGHQRRVSVVIERHAAEQVRALGYQLRAQAAG